MNRSPVIGRMSVLCAIVLATACGNTPAETNDDWDYSAALVKGALVTADGGPIVGALVEVVSLQPVTESPRVCRRLRFVRRWSHGQAHAVFS